MKPLNSKLTRPRVEGIVKRSRLLKQLDSAARKGLVWISAPAGSGKTTLVADWLASGKRPCLWYQADEGDVDIASFFSYLGQAAKSVSPRRRAALPLFTPEYRLGLPTFTKRFFETLFTRLGPQGCLVIDNYQEVPCDALFHEVVRDGAGLAPEGVSVVIVSRTDPPPAYARAQAGGRLEFVDRNTISFTLEESRLLVRSREKRKTPGHIIETLYEKTRGWAAGLVLLTGGAAKSGEFAGLPDLSNGRIFDFFSQELFDRADAETRAFLLTTAFLPAMTARAASQLTGCVHAEKLLSGFSRRNFFIQIHVTPALVYEFHPLFREFLLKRAGEFFTHEERDNIRRKAASLLLATGRTEEAAGLLCDAADWQGLTSLVIEAAKEFTAAGKFLTIGTWINKIPTDVVENDGGLLYWKAMCLMATRPSEAREHLEKA